MTMKKPMTSKFAAAFGALALLTLAGFPPASGAQATAEPVDRAFGAVWNDDRSEDPSRNVLLDVAKCTYEQACTWCASNCATFCESCLDRTFTCGATSGGACACYCACKVCPETANLLVGRLALG